MYYTVGMFYAFPILLQVSSTEGAYGSLYQRLALSHLKPVHGFLKTPFDLYCPSTVNTLVKRVCQQCGHYFPSQSARRIHSRIHKIHTAEAANAEDDSDNDDADAAQQQQPTSAAGADVSAADGMPVVRNLFDWLQSAFVDTN